MVSTIFIVIGEIVATLAVFLAAWFWKPTLETVGFIYLINIGIMLWITILVIFLKGWFRRYYCGLFGSFAMAVSRDCSIFEKLSRSLFYPLLTRRFPLYRTALLFV